MKPKMITDALNNIRAAVRRQEAVEFVVHFWRPFINIGMNGFRFPSIPAAEIPAAQLIPLVQQSQIHLDSVIDSRTNKVKPYKVPYTQEIKESFTDLQRRFGKYGLIRVPEFSCTLEEAEELMGEFSVAMSGWTGLLQDLPAYFGGQSPVYSQFDTLTSNQKTTIYDVLDKYPATWATDMIRGAVPTLFSSADRAHMTALNPQGGVLHQSITAINEGQKKSFDEVDLWLIRQFPGFDADNRLTGQKANSDIAKLTEVMTTAFAGLASGGAGKVAKAVESVVPTLDQLSEDDKAALMKEFAALQEREKAASSEDTESVADEKPLKGEHVKIDRSTLPAAIVQCSAITGSGNRCKNETAPGSLYCKLPAHMKLAE